MAYGDIGIFQPAESHYKTPGSYEAMMKAEALKRANYLAAMDQFYENLNEARRQFSETLAFKKETRDLELDFAREKLETTSRLEEERLASEKAYRSRMLGLAEQELELKRSSTVGSIGGTVSQGDILDFLGEQAEKQREAGFETAKLFAGPSPMASGKIEAPETSYNKPYYDPFWEWDKDFYGIVE